MLKTTLQEIADRAEAATPGPWDAGRPGNGSPGYVYSDDATGSAIACVALEWVHRSGAQIEANARFIAHARTDIPALLSELQKAREALGWDVGLGKSILEALADERNHPDEWLGGGSLLELWRYEARRALALPALAALSSPPLEDDAAPPPGGGL
jgi:hypothetical protein